MKIMISQPMKGKSENEIREERKKVTEILEKEGHEIVDTIFAEEPPKNSDIALFYLAKSIDAMSKIDAVVFISNWKQARGCIIEHEIAIAYNKFVREL